MVKLVVLKLDGSLEQGFRVNLEIGEEEKRPYAQLSGELPPAPELLNSLRTWQRQYRQLGTGERIKPKEIIYGGSISSFVSLRKCARKLETELSSWLESKSFYGVNNRLREELDPTEGIRVLLATNNQEVYQLPWCQWNFVDRYSNVEIAFSNLEFEQFSVIQTRKKSKKVRILAILGHSQGINLEEDKKLLTAISEAEVVFLVEPERQKLNNYLWEQTWDIVFFAGHSETKQNQGLIHLNSQDILTIEEIKFALKCAIASGLQLAIFNSCDGMGLAHQLGNLSLPQIIVMREPVPDRIAQEFLKHFLYSFASGNSLYLATKYARERLQGWEHRYPCASWLPIIYQNQAVNPPNWQELKRGRPKKSFAGEYEPLGLLSALIIGLLFLVRSLGGLQNWELQAMDWLMRLRHLEPPDKRILVITIDDRDIQYQQQQGMELKGSLADEALDKLLNKLEPYHPKAIASDIIHDFPFSAELAKNIAQNESFFSICRIQTEESDLIEIEPPPHVQIQRLGFSNLVIDPDDTIRRHILGMSPGQLCQSHQSLSLRLALYYLNNPSGKLTTKGLQIDRVLLPQLNRNAGGYQLPVKELQGTQILLNYRSSSPETIPLREVLDGSRNQELSQLVPERIIFIGVSKNNQDIHKTPYSQDKKSHQWSGVFIHAQMTSQIISAVLDKRPLLWWLPEWLEMIWIAVWSLLGVAMILVWQTLKSRIVANLVSLTILFGCCWVTFSYGGWLPLVPSALGILATTGAISYYQKKSL
jgi:CHASE2 domain-containing sensor protein